MAQLMNRRKTTRLTAQSKSIDLFSVPWRARLLAAKKLYRKTESSLFSFPPARSSPGQDPVEPHGPGREHERDQAEAPEVVVREQRGLEAVAALHGNDGQHAGEVAEPEVGEPYGQADQALAPRDAGHGEEQGEEEEERFPRSGILGDEEVERGLVSRERGGELSAVLGHEVAEPAEGPGGL